MKRFNVYRDDEYPNYGDYDEGSYDTLEEALTVKSEANHQWMSRYCKIYDNELKRNVCTSEEPWKSMLK